jgi:benzodiazapine receptor
MISSGLIIAIVAVLIFFVLNRLSTRERNWFNNLYRPRWLTFEWAIPLIWIGIFICGAWSANIVWNNQPESYKTWLFMSGYLLLEVLILAYTPVMCKLRSLRVGTIIGAIGFFWGLFLAIQVFSVSKLAVKLLLPYLLWSPIGTYVTWQMIRLNPRDA